MSSLRSRLRAVTRRAGSADSGLSLIELVVAMAIFTIVLGIYFSALISMSRTTVRAQDTVDASDALRATFNMMDRQVRYATSVNRPGQGGSGWWYVEFEATDLPEDQPPVCYQWRLDSTNQVLSFRTWSQDGASTVTPWRGVAWNVESDGGGAPFVFTQAEGSTLRQSLTVKLRVTGPTTGEVAAQSTTFVARNSSYKSPSNLDTNSDGASDTPVCLTGMDRP